MNLSSPYEGVRERARGREQATGSLRSQIKARGGLVRTSTVSNLRKQGGVKPFLLQRSCGESSPRGTAVSK